MCKVVVHAGALLVNGAAHTEHGLTHNGTTPAPVFNPAPSSVCPDVYNNVAQRIARREGCKARVIRGKRVIRGRGRHLAVSFRAWAAKSFQHAGKGTPTGGVLLEPARRFWC
jgi:hypothetical protein